MYEDSQHEEYLEDNEDYDLLPEIMELEINIDEINTILDKHLDEEEVTEEESKLVVMYILQLFYRSGRRSSNTTITYEKYNMLIASRAIELLNGMGIIEELYDTEKEEYVYKLNENGKKYVENML